MKRRNEFWLCLLPWLAAACAGTQGPSARNRSICVPSANGQTWECGSESSPPPARGLPAHAATPPPTEPPPYFLAGPGQETHTGAPESEPPQSPVGVNSDPTAGAVPTTATPGSEAATAVQPNGEHAAPEATAAAAPEVVPPTSNHGLIATAHSIHGMQTSTDFLRLPPSAYTVQVARATTPDDLLAAAQALASQGYAPLYLLEIEITGQRWWLLVHASFQHAAQAHAALRELSAHAPTSPLSVRRIGPLQGEVRRSQDIP